LGLTIFSIIAACLYATFSVGTRVRSLHDLCREARFAADALAMDLENAFVYDFSASYPQEISFKGTPQAMTFLVPDKDGIRAVEYSSGRPDFGLVAKTVVGRRIKKTSRVTTSSKQEDPREFLMRKAVPLEAYVGRLGKGEGEIIAAGLKKGGLALSYGVITMMPDPSTGRMEPQPVFQDQWDKPSLPAIVRVKLVFLDNEDLQSPGLTLTRDIVLPVAK
jgi:hypothetical protein